MLHHLGAPLFSVQKVTVENYANDRRRLLLVGANEPIMVLALRGNSLHVILCGKNVDFQT